MIELAKIISAVFIGNLLFAVFFIGVWQIQKHENKGHDASTAPLWLFFCVLAPLCLVIIGIYLVEA